MKNDFIYIFGHKKPDTDSVVSAIALSKLKNALGINSKPFVLGKINNETKFILDYLKVEEPEYLHDIKLEIKDLDFQKDISIREYDSIYKTYNFLYDNYISTVPIVDKNNYFIGGVSTKDILEKIIHRNIEVLDTAYENVIDTINGTQILKFTSDIYGKILVNECIDIENIIIGNKEIDFNAYTNLIIYSGNLPSETYIKKCKDKKINLIYTQYDIVNTIKNIYLSNYIRIITNRNIITVNDNTEVDDFLKLVNKTKRTNYPVLNEKNECLGIVSLADINKKNEKKVILVDHNEQEQSVDGLDEAEILEVIDHHKIGMSKTKTPINFRNIPVGSTSTIIYMMCKESNMKLDKQTAGLLLGGIISDTLYLKSPTSTAVDERAIKELAKTSKINAPKYSEQIFEARSILENNIEDIIFDDFKSFKVNSFEIGISQITTTNYNQVLKRKKEIINTIEKIDKGNEYDLFILIVTDIFNNGSYIYYTKSKENLIKKGFELDTVEQGTFLKEVLSRKKQIIPAIYKALE